MRLRVWLIFIVLLGGVLRFHNLTEVLVRGQLYFVDADCYSRMTRAEWVSASPGRLVRHQLFENWPAGVRSHATAPMDYLIVGGERLVRWVWPTSGRWAALRRESLDVSGALISPVLGVLGVLALGLWASGLRNAEGGHLSGGWTVPFFSAVSPPLVHATVLGRPDHQSLLLVLLAGAMVCEHGLFKGWARLAWSALGGTLWGVSLWVSLFEPLVLLAAIVAGGWLSLREMWWSRERGVWAGALLGVLLCAWGLGDLRLDLPENSMWRALSLWGGTIGELQRLWSPSRLWFWFGALVWVWPGLVWMGSRSFEERERRFFRVLGGVGLGVMGLTFWQVRWAPFAALLFGMTLPVALSAWKPRSRLWGILAGWLALVPLAGEWWERAFPEAGQAERQHLDRSERIHARLAAERMRSEEVTPFLAVWWLSPAMAYWSGQPAVAGSGHEGIGGIHDSARFFLSQTPEQARTILEARRVSWVVASDPARAVRNSSEVLRMEPMGKPLAEILWEPNLEWVWGLQGERNVTSFRLLRVLPADAPEFGGGSTPR